MLIKHDRSYISPEAKPFIDRGFAEEDLYSVHLTFEYTEEQKAENVARANASTREEWNRSCVEAALYRSEYMRSVMEAIAKVFPCHQFAPDDTTVFRSPDWQFFFWCNSLFPYGAPGNFPNGRDYSHISLTFNDRHTALYHASICHHLLCFLEQHFGHLENLKVRIQYTTRYFDDKIAAAASHASQQLEGKRCTYAGKEGRIVIANDQLYFMKKYAKNHGYLLDDHDILKIFWRMEASA